MRGLFNLNHNPLEMLLHLKSNCTKKNKTNLSIILKTAILV